MIPVHYLPEPIPSLYHDLVAVMVRPKNEDARPDFSAEDLAKRYTAI
jgi:hypothetical protein